MELHGIDELFAVLVYQIIRAHDLIVSRHKGAPVIGFIVHRLAVLNAAGIAFVVVEAGADHFAAVVGLIRKHGKLVVAAQLKNGHLGVQSHDIHFRIDALAFAGQATGLCSGYLRLDLVFILSHYLQGAINAGVLGRNTDREFIVGINFQQQGQAVAQTGIVGSIAGVIFKGAPAFFNDAAVIIAPVAVRNGYLALGSQI